MDNYLKVIKILKENQDKFISGEKIAKMCGISRVGVYKIIKKLISEGYEIKKNKKLGYKLLFSAFSPEDILKKNLSIVSKIYHFKKTSSTMDVAKKILDETPNIENVLIIADIQTSGKGRLQRKWFSPKGGLYFSLILKPQISPNIVFNLNYLFSLSIAEVLRENYNISATTKWPNDVVVEDKKISGILIEIDTEIDKLNWCIVGVGVNLNINKEFFIKNKLQATSVLELTNKKVDINEFLSKLLEKIDLYYKDFIKNEYKQIIEKWSKISSTLGREVEIITLTTKIKGKAIKLQQDTGALLVETPSGIKEVLSGDCVHLR
ncbi:MAG: biotin--[acetyl-CoA-carboxylase] ligase [Elusimicrobiota bacterium]|nr:biotin--[acetyl-CoA-carboxylase] ligase [Endomicrobiia bacterium]MDW8165696.1 biotin--[acetyl-CoA-carboxylase] ligase [Elusimicrobiota bacterium]